MVVLSDAIRARRDSFGLSSKGAAVLAGLSAESWSRFERGSRVPSPTSAMKMARALRWPPDALERITAGEDPTSLQTVDPDAAVTASAASGTPDDAVAAMLRTLPAAVQRKFRAEIAAAWSAEHGGGLA